VTVNGKRQAVWYPLMASDGTPCTTSRNQRGVCTSAFANNSLGQSNLAKMHRTPSPFDAGAFWAPTQYNALWVGPQSPPRTGPRSVKPFSYSAATWQADWETDHTTVSAVAVVVQYGMYSRRIFVLKLIFLLLWIQLGSHCQKMKGFKFFSHSPFFFWGGGVISVLDPLELTMYLFPPFVNRF